MSKGILLATFLVELILEIFRRSKARVRGKLDVDMKWELLPYDLSKIDYLGSDADKGVLKPPKVRNPRSRDV